MGFNSGFKGLKHLKKIVPTCFGPIFKTIFRGLVEPPEDGLKNGTETCRGKFLSVFNVNLSNF